ncbi:MAG: hypothetical protein II923_05315 [Campylobacter sp.]|nr:hypothetical protein [Campylobacter sp.]
MKIIDKIKKKISEFVDFVKSKFTKQDIDSNILKGDNFIIENPNLGKTQTDYNIKMHLEPKVRDMANITTDEILVDLEYFADKHPEIFKGKPSKVFRLINEIKDNPTFFYNNNRADYALIVKRLRELNKIGKLAVEKSSGITKHATSVNENDLGRLERVSKKNQNGVSALSELSSDKVAKLEEQGSGYQADEIIPQETKQSNIADNITQIEEKEFKLDLSGTDGNDSTDMDKTRTEHNKKSDTDTDTDKTDGNKPRKNKQ